MLDFVAMKEIRFDGIASHDVLVFVRRREILDGPAVNGLLAHLLHQLLRSGTLAGCVRSSMVWC